MDELADLANFMGIEPAPPQSPSKPEKLQAKVDDAAHGDPRSLFQKIWQGI